MQLLLRVMGHESPQLVLRFLPGQYRLGRSSSCQVRLQDNTVSRLHAELNVGPDRASVRDLGSRHGTLVNGWWATEERPLHDGDRLAIAWRIFRTQILADDADPGPACVTVPGEGEGIVVPASTGNSLSETKGPTYGMGTRLYIHGPRGYRPWFDVEIERALNDFLRGQGHVMADEDQGPGWGIDLVLHAGADVEAWVGRLVAFLQDRQVPNGTAVSFTTYPADGGFTHRRIEIPVK